MGVVCLAEVNLSCFDQVLLLFSEEHRLHHLPSLRFLLSLRDASYCECRIPSSFPNANSFLYVMRTYVFFCLFCFLSYYFGGRFPVFMLISWRTANNHILWKGRLHGASGKEQNVGFSCLAWLYGLFVRTLISVTNAYAGCGRPTLNFTERF